MTNFPKVSVVIPCHNAAPYVASAIDSIVEQKWPNLEIILVDDGSSDGSAELAAAHGAGVRLIRQPNAGPAAARNAGITAACGEYVAFLDADDLWLPQKLERQLQLIQATPHARMAYGSWHVWFSDGVRPRADWLQNMDEQHLKEGVANGASGWVYCDLLLDTILNCSTVIAHRSLFDEVGLFDVSLPVGEDYDLWIRMSRVTPIVRVREAVALYRLHPNCTTRKARVDNYQAMVLNRALGRWGYIGPDGSVADKTQVRVGLARTWRDFAAGHLRERSWHRALAASATAVRLNPKDLRAIKILARSLLRI